MRAFIEAPVVKFSLTIGEFRDTINNSKLVDIFTDHKKTTFAGVEMRINTIKHVLINCYRTDCCCRFAVVCNINRVNGGMSVCVYEQLCATKSS